MSEKRFVLCKKGDVEYIEDNGCVQLYGFDVLCEMLNEQQSTIEQLQEENKELEKNFDDLVEWASEIAKRNVLLDEKIGRLQQEEKLYAQEILRLNTLLKQYQANQDLGGGY